MEHTLLKSIFYLTLLFIAYFSPATELAGYSFGITQDKSGFIYQASQKGGFRLDGENYVPLSDLFEVPNNWLEDVRYLEKNNELLLAYGDLGLYKIDLNNNQTSLLTNSGCWRIGIIENVIYCLRGHKLNSYEYEGKKLEPMKLLPDDLKVHSIADGYIDTDVGLFMVDGNTAKLIDKTPAMYTKISNNEYGLVAWRDQALYYYDSFGKSKSIPWPTMPKSIYALGNTVFIEKNGAVVHLNLMDFSVINEKVNVVNSPIRRIFKDDAENMWFISSNNVQIKPAAITQISLPISSDYNIKVLSEGGFFVGTEQGVYKKVGDKFTLIGDPKEYGYVITDLEVIDETLYIASNKGLTKYNFKNNASEKLYDRYVIGLSKKSKLLFVSSSFEGVFTYDGEHFLELYDVNSPLHNNEILDVKFIEDNTYILSAEGFYSKDKLNRIGYHGSEIGIVVDAVKYQNAIFFGTFGNGLFKYQDSKLTRVDSPQSIIDLIVHQNDLFIGTIDGVYRYNDYMYSLMPGTSGLNVTPNSMLLENNNELTFGTQFGLTTIKLANKPTQLEPSIKTIRVGNTYLSDQLERYDASKQVSLYISNGSFVGKSEYAYSINNEWITVESGVINFHNIRPGTYEVNYKSRINGGQWVKGKPIKLTFFGKWYESAAVTVLIFLIPALIISLIILVVVLLLKANYGVHKKLYNMLGSCELNKILTTLIRAKSACSSPDLNKLADGLVELDKAIDELVPLAHGNAALGKRTIQQGLDALKAALQFEQINLNFEYTISISNNKKLESDLERDIYALVYHSIRNSVDHGKANQVEVFVEQVRNQVHVSILDNGIGCSLYARTFKYGLGLYVMRDIAKKYKAKLNFKSSSSGTSISIGFPLSVTSKLFRNEKAPS